MTMKLAWVNYLDDADLSADQQIVTLPVTNVTHPYPSKQWRTPAGITSAYMIADLGSAKSVEVWAVAATNLTAGATMRIRASTADPTCVASLIYDSGTLAGQFDDNYRSAYGALPAATSARYWRIDLSDAGVAEGNLRIGRAWLGPAWTPSANLSYGWGKTYLDGSRITETASGAEFVDEGPRARLFEFTLGFMNSAEMHANAFELARRNGQSRDVLVMISPGGATSVQDSIIGLIKRAEPLVQEQFAIFRQRYTIRERAFYAA